MEKQENKIAHLQFIENIIKKMGKNSFSLKGWSITVMIAIFAFVGQSNNKAIIITIIPLILFWLLDTYYLLVERKYKKLYDEVRVKKDNEIDFDLNSKNVALKMGDIGKFQYLKIMFSKTEWTFYAVCIITTVLIYLI